jgi:hypothetical protein
VRLLKAISRKGKTTQNRGWGEKVADDDITNRTQSSQECTGFS